MKHSFTFVDLFAGIGGFHEALKSIGGKCVAACEIDKQARLTYSSNHSVPPQYFYEDIFSINPESFPNHDILCAGFPCQPFSISGKQKALEDQRSHVITPLFDIISSKMPKIVILENVKHLKHVSKGVVFDTLIERLAKLGYNVSTKLVNAKDFGVPQNRERWLIIGVLGFKFDFREYHGKDTIIRDILEQNGDFTYLDEPFTLIPEIKKQKSSGLIFCGYRNKKIRVAGVKENTEHLSRVHKQPNRIYSIDGTHPTLPSQESSGRFWIKLDNGKVRKLTILECFRLMGFKDDFIKPVPLGRLYLQIGNSVCVPMIRTVAEWIIQDMRQFKKEASNV